MRALLIILILAAIGAVVFIFIRRRGMSAEEKIERDLLEKAKQYQQQNGGSLEDAFKAVARVACQGVAANYGVPPNISGSLCGPLATIGIAALKYVGKEAAELASSIASGASKVAKAVVGAVEAGAKGVAKGAEVGAKTVAKGAEKVYDVGKGAVNAVEDFFSGSDTNWAAMSDATLASKLATFKAYRAKLPSIPQNAQIRMLYDKWIREVQATIDGRAAQKSIVASFQEKERRKAEIAAQQKAEADKAIQIAKAAVARATATPENIAAAEAAARSQAAAQQAQAAAAASRAAPTPTPVVGVTPVSAVKNVAFSLAGKKPL